VIDLNLRSYFDTVRHHIVLAKVARRVSDDAVLWLLRLLLKASGRLGVPQGGVISPLLSNVYLNDVDTMLERAKKVTRVERWTYVEYARFGDDLVILVDGHPRQRRLRAAVERQLREELATLQVEVNEEKTRRVDRTQGERFGFLGFDFRRIRSRRDRWMPLRTPRGKKRTALLRTLKQVFRSYRSRPISEVIAQSTRFCVAGCSTLRLAIRAGAFRTFETGSRRRFGTIWCGPASVTVSVGSGGVEPGCMGRSDFSRSTALPADPRQPPFRLERPITLAAKRCRSA